MQINEISVTLRAKYYETGVTMKGYTIDYKSLSLGEHSFDFEVGADLFEQYDYSEIKGGCCRVKINMIYSETMIDMEVTIQGDVTVECDRCLEDCSVDIDFDAPLIVKICSEIGDEQGEELSDGEVIWLPQSESTLDLSQYIYESIILSLPYQRVHAEGECNPEMIERFKIVSSQEFEAIERRSQQGESKTIPGSEISKLEALKREMEKE
ncbi:MAG: DUF177 domain-containing protein [Rikenellaceae bacterium]